MTSGREDPRARFERVRELFDRVRDLDQAVRQELLAREPQELAEEVLALCRADARFGPEPDDAETRGGMTEPPTRVGRYRVGGLLGSGGASDVFAGIADKVDDPAVALKILRAAASPEQRIRFAFEGHALAQLDHPGIARVYEVGALPDGRPYLILQLIPDAVALVTFCDRRRLGIRDRVALLVEVCQAVEHAHQRGFIHRDLKPSNILVTDAAGRREPYVIDFGIAKLLDGDPLNRLTGTGVWRGTPGYMSPEQADARSQQVDLPSDVYALGAILCELLTGELPGRAIDPRPSVVLGPTTHGSDRTNEVASQRDTTPTDLRRSLRGELDWITARALQPEREKRYPDVSRLREDLDRFLRGLPVVGVATSLGYRARLFARRHRKGVTAAAACTLLFGAAAASLIQRRIQLGTDLDGLLDKAARDVEQAIALREENPNVPPRALEAVKRARSELARAEEKAHHWLAPNRRTTLSNLIRTADTREEEFRSQGLARELLMSLPTGSSKRFAETQVSRAKDLLRALGLDVDQTSDDDLRSWLIAHQRDMLGQHAAAVLLGLAMNLGTLGDRDRRDRVRRLVVESASSVWRELIARADPQAVIESAKSLEWREQSVPSALGLAGDLMSLGATHVAIAGLEQLLLAHPDDELVLFQYAQCLRSGPAPDWERARLAQRAVVAAAPHSFAGWLWLAEVESQLDAARLLSTLEETVRRFPDKAYAHDRLGWCHWRHGRLDEAEAALRRALELDAGLAMSQTGLALVLLDRGQHELALSAVQSACEADPDLHPARQTQVRALRALHRDDEALKAASEVLKVAWTGNDHVVLADLLEDAGRHARAAEHYRCAAELRHEPQQTWLFSARAAIAANDRKLAEFAFWRGLGIGTESPSHLVTLVQHSLEITDERVASARSAESPGMPSDKLAYACLHETDEPARAAAAWLAAYAADPEGARPWQLFATARAQLRIASTQGGLGNIRWFDFGHRALDLLEGQVSEQPASAPEIHQQMLLWMNDPTTRRPMGIAFARRESLDTDELKETSRLLDRIKKLRDRTR